MASLVAIANSPHKPYKVVEVTINIAKTKSVVDIAIVIVVITMRTDTHGNSKHMRHFASTIQRSGLACVMALNSTIVQSPTDCIYDACHSHFERGLEENSSSAVRSGYDLLTADIFKDMRSLRHVSIQRWSIHLNNMPPQVGTASMLGKASMLNGAGGLFKPT